SSLAAAVEAKTAPSLVQAVLRRWRWQRAARLAESAVALLLIGGLMFLAIRQRQSARAAELAAASRSVNSAIRAIDRAFTSNDPAGFVSLIHFRDAEDEQFKPVLAKYVEAESLFRREMQQKLNVRQRTFDLTFHELFL